MAVIFSIPAFFIVLREVLEACLVVGIVLAYLDKVGATQYRKWVWLAIAAGVGGSVAAGVAFAIVFFVRGDQLFSGNAEKIFEGITFLIAAALLTWMIIWVMMLGKNLRNKMEQELDDILEKSRSTRAMKTSIFFMVFVQILREGIETVIFLIGTAGADDVGGWRAIPLPGVLALIVGVFGSYLAFRGLVYLDINSFLRWSAYILVAFAAGLVSHAFHELQEVDLFGPWKPSEERDWYNATMWSTKDCCHDKENQFFAMLRALFGYQDTPTFVEWVTYFAYWLIVIIIFLYVNWSYIRSSRNSVASLTRKMILLSGLFTFVGFVYSMINVTWIGALTMTVGLILSVVGTAAIFEIAPNRVKIPRKAISFATGIAFSALTLFMLILHLVELQCQGGEQCSINIFYFFGLIFDGDFSATGRQEKSWPSIAILSISLVVTLFFFGALSLSLILFSFNFDGEGQYISDSEILRTTDDTEPESVISPQDISPGNAEDVKV